MQSLCLNLHPCHKLKKSLIFKEGDPCKFIYFIKEGEVSLSKKVGLPQKDKTLENVHDLLENPVRYLLRQQSQSNPESKKHALGL